MQAPVGVVVERGGVVGWREAVDSLARLGVAGCAWARLVGIVWGDAAGRGWLAGDASAVGVARVA